MSINVTAEKICSTRDTVAYELTTCQLLMFPLLKSSKQKSLPSWRKFLRRQKSSLLIWSSMLLIWCPTGKSARCSVNWRRRGESKKKNSAAPTITWRRKSSSGKPSKDSFSYTNNEFSSRSVKCLQSLMILWFSFTAFHPAKSGYLWSVWPSATIQIREVFKVEKKGWKNPVGGKKG